MVAARKYQGTLRPAMRKSSASWMRRALRVPRTKMKPR
jgi:hypothetical protein